MKLQDVEVGKIYQCKLSGKKMLIYASKKAVQTPNGETNEDGTPTIITTSEDVKAGKYFERSDDYTGSFKLEEIYEGQVEEI